MSDTHFGDPATLEEQLETWLEREIRLPLNEEQKRDLVRILQLARREGYGKRAGETSINLQRDEIERWGRKAFPILRTVTEPRIGIDPHGFQFRVVARDLQHRAGNSEQWADGGVFVVTWPRVAIWTDLFDNPTVTREVEE